MLLLKEQFLKEQLRGLCECLSVTGHKKNNYVPSKRPASIALLS